MEWYENIFPSIMTRLKVESKKALGSTFTDLEVTDEIVAPTNPSFPTILALELPNTEQGNDLVNVDIVALMYGIQIEVTDNKKQANAKQVMNEVIKIMKSMGFSVLSMPEITYANNVYRLVARFKRIIANGDNL